MADILPESPGLFFVCKAYRILYSVVWHYVALIGGKGVIRCISCLNLLLAMAIYNVGFLRIVWNK